MRQLGFSSRSIWVTFYFQNVCLASLLFASRLICVMFDLRHVLFVSRSICVPFDYFNVCLASLLFASRSICVMFDLCHVLFASRLRHSQKKSIVNKAKVELDIVHMGVISVAFSLRRESKGL